MGREKRQYNFTKIGTWCTRDGLSDDGTTKDWKKNTKRSWHARIEEQGEKEENGKSEVR